MTLPMAKSRVVSDSPRANLRERRVESAELWTKFAASEFQTIAVCNDTDR